MDKLTCFFKKAFDFSHQKVWLEGTPPPAGSEGAEERNFAAMSRLKPGDAGYVHRKGGPDDTGADKAEAKADATKGDTSFVEDVDARKREFDKDVAGKAGLLGILSRGMGSSPLFTESHTNLDTSGILASADVPGAEGTRSVAGEYDLGIDKPEVAGTQLASIQLGPPIVPLRSNREVAAAVPAEVREGRMMEESAANLEYARDKLMTDATELLRKEAGPDGKIKTADDSAIVKALIVATRGDEGWTQFQKDYVKASKTAGKSWDGKAIENFQRDWFKNNCGGRADLYADIAELKATKLNQGSETIVKYAGRPGGATPEKPFDILRYEISRALGITGQPLSGEDLYALYSDTPYVGKDAIAKALTVKGAKVTVSPEGQIYIRTPDNMAVALAPSVKGEAAVRAKLEQLKKKV